MLMSQVLMSLKPAVVDGSDPYEVAMRVELLRCVAVGVSAQPDDY